MYCSGDTHTLYSSCWTVGWVRWFLPLAPPCCFSVLISLFPKMGASPTLDCRIAVSDWLSGRRSRFKEPPPYLQDWQSLPTPARPAFLPRSHRQNIDDESQERPTAFSCRSFLRFLPNTFLGSPERWSFQSKQECEPRRNAPLNVHK